MANTSNHLEPQNLVEAIRYFSDDELAFAFVMRMRWNDGPVICPRCQHNETTFVQTRRIWRCKGCRKQFSIKVGTIFEDSPIGFDKWLPAVWLISNSKNSVSSHELGRALGVTQKTAWFMLHRIRLAFETPAYKQFRGTVEVDETYVGGKAKNMHMWKRQIRVRGRGMVGKTPVQGIRERETGQVRAEVVRDPGKGKTYAQNVTDWVTLGSTVYTDQFSGYRRLGEKFQHDYVTHTNGEYVRGEIHVNGMENFWSLLKRALKGTQTHANPEHLHRYVQERVFSYNNCFADDIGRMKLAMRRTAGRRITYAELISGK